MDKLLLVLLTLVISGCVEEIEDAPKNWDKIKYGSQFIVEDEFYGKGVCKTLLKSSPETLNRYSVKGDCIFSRGYQDTFWFNVKDITLVEVTEKSLKDALEKIKIKEIRKSFNCEALEKLNLSRPVCCIDPLNILCRRDSE